MQSPSKLPDVPLALARAILEEAGVDIEEGPAGDWAMSKGETYLPLVPSGTMMPSMVLCFLCERFALNPADVIIMIDRRRQALEEVNFKERGA